MCLLELCPKHERAGLKRGLQGHPTSMGFSARTLTATWATQRAFYTFAAEFQVAEIEDP